MCKTMYLTGQQNWKLASGQRDVQFTHVIPRDFYQRSHTYFSHTYFSSLYLHTYYLNYNFTILHLYDMCGILLSAKLLYAESGSLKQILQTVPTAPSPMDRSGLFLRDSVTICTARSGLCQMGIGKQATHGHRQAGMGIGKQATNA